MVSTGTLFVVATPIGNLEDITFRAVRILKEVDFVVAEDTRVSLKLLSHLHIKKPIERLDENAPPGRIDAIVERLVKGQSVALVTDAGTPNISDPGYKLVARCHERGIRQIVPVPGPSALTALVSISHFSMNSFVFWGFPPAKKGRKRFFDTVASESLPVALYESPHRILKTIRELASRVPERQALVAKELTKIHERTWRGSIEGIGHATEGLEEKELKGEWVIALARQ